MNKDFLVREYLRQQQMNNEFADNLINGENILVHKNQAGIREANTYTQEDSIEEFKEKVKNWIKLDLEVKSINAKIKMLDIERKNRKKFMEALSESILKFMTQNEIDELNSKEGIVRFKKSSVKKPYSQKELINRLKSEFESVTDAEQKIRDIFYKNRERLERTKLILKN
jgi:hypothetical protein